MRYQHSLRMTENFLAFYFDERGHLSVLCSDFWRELCRHFKCCSSREFKKTRVLITSANLAGQVVSTMDLL